MWLPRSGDCKSNERLQVSACKPASASKPVQVSQCSSTAWARTCRCTTIIRRRRQKHWRANPRVAQTFGQHRAGCFSAHCSQRSCLIMRSMYQSGLITARQAQADHLQRPRSSSAQQHKQATVPNISANSDPAYRHGTANQISCHHRPMTQVSGGSTCPAGTTPIGPSVWSLHKTDPTFPIIY